MLDKTLPYFNVIVRRRAGLPIAIHRLPSGLSVAEVVLGDEVPWGRIETSVGEFMTDGADFTYFQATCLDPGPATSPTTPTTKQDASPGSGRTGGPRGEGPTPRRGPPPADQREGGRKPTGC